ncbi:MAG: hypothetical protein V8R22_02195 [Lachnospiraceae bacterium]
MYEAEEKNMIDIVHYISNWCPQEGIYENKIVIYDDNWNDYGYRTTFHMVYFDKKGKMNEIGDIKIYNFYFDEMRNPHYDINVSTELPGNIIQLSEKFCSLGQNLTFYQNLKQLFPKYYMSILKRLNDIATNEIIRNAYEDEHGVQTSLLRDSSAEKALNEAADLLMHDSTKENDISFRYALEVPYSDLQNEVFFDFKKTQDIPFRINALVGKMGLVKRRSLQA